MSYIDGFIVPVPTAKKGAYREMSEKAAKVFMEYGALRLVECWGDDVPDGKVTDFKRAVAAEPTETIVFSWIVWPSKEVRDEAIKKIEKDERMRMTPDTPFDGKRMIFGGFQPICDTKEELNR